MTRLVLSLILVCVSATPLCAQFVTHHASVFQSLVAQPAKGAAIDDPHFGARITRLTNARADGAPGYMPQYAKRQAWNADGSLLLLFSGDGRTLLHDGVSGSFVREIEGPGGEDVFWHPADPRRIIYAEDNRLSMYDVTTDVVTTLRAFPQYSWINTRGEGNLSADGNLYAFAGQFYDSTVHFRDLVLYDIARDSVLGTLPLPETLADFDWVSISPSGDFVVVDYATSDTGLYQGVEVYDRAFRRLWQKPLGSGHSDLGIDTDGQDVLVMGVYNADSNRTYIRKYRLSDAAETVLLDHEWSVYNHISLRNTRLRGFCLVSTYDGEGRLEDDSTGWLPFEDEIFLLALDGSGSVRRLAHHRSRRFSPATPDSDNSVYWAEPHASPDPDGRRVVFGSNWRLRLESDSSVDAYIADVSHLTHFPESPAPASTTLRLGPVYPNPWSVSAAVGFTLPAAGRVLLTMHDALGRECARFTDAAFEGGTHMVAITRGSLRAGCYRICCRTTSGVSSMGCIITGE